MAGLYSCLVLTILMTVVARAESDEDLCHRGFKIARKFQDCWDVATPALRPSGGSEYTGKMLEGFATHMCSVVKPTALECLKQEVSECPNVDKIVEIADESGGACLKNKMNPYFKLYITDLLQPIRMDNPCFLMDAEAYKCYQQAAAQVTKSGDSHQDISRFHKVADTFFGHIWSCHINLYKGKSDVCPNWQIPMLISLQSNAMKSLFGMKLNNHQIAMLELGSKLMPTMTSKIEPEKYKDKKISNFLLLRVIKDKSIARAGDIVLKLDTEVEAPVQSQSELSVEDGQSEEMKDFMKTVSSPKGGINMKALKKWIKYRIREDKKKKAEVSDWLKGFKGPKGMN